jgi:hypothetical protein
MGKPYSQDLRERVIAGVDTGTGAYVAALLFQVSVSYIYKALIRRRKTGEVTATSDQQAACNGRGNLGGIFHFLSPWACDSHPSSIDLKRIPRF